MRCIPRATYFFSYLISTSLLVLTLSFSTNVNSSLRRQRGSPTVSISSIPENYLQRLHHNNHFQQKRHSSISLTRTNASLKNSDFNSKNKNRPEWALDWMPTRLITMSPISQIFTLLIFYYLHLTIFTQNCIAFPFQLIPNNKGKFQSIGLDSLAGIFSYVGLIVLRKQQMKKYKTKKYNKSILVPSIWSTPKNEDLPWKISSQDTHNDTGDYSDKTIATEKPKTKSIWRYDEEERIHTQTPSAAAFRAFTYLIIAYTATGRFSQWIESLLYILVGLNFCQMQNWMSIAMHRSLVVLFGHLAWVFVGCFILEKELHFFSDVKKLKKEVIRKQNYFKKKRMEIMEQADKRKKLDTFWFKWVLRDYYFPGFFSNIKKYLYTLADLKSFFITTKGRIFHNSTNNDTNKDKSTEIKENQTSTKTPRDIWYTKKFDTYWLWWTLGGYFVSAWLFNIADFLNQLILPSSIFDNAGEGVVSQLVNPENNDILASIIGYIAPCISAPWWEEILYRGFMLPMLTQHFSSFWIAVLVNSLIFSAHHLSTTGFIPLTILGFVWATLYAKCGNLWVTIVIHAMWNSRVFLGSWFGL